MKNLLLLLTAVLPLTLLSCSSGEDTLKIVSFNMRYSTPDDGDNCWENRKGAVVNMVSTILPDVMGTQECLVGMDAYLMENLPGYGHIGVNDDERYQKMAIYYNKERLELEDSGTFWLSETPDSVSFGWDAACIRTVTWGCFRLKESGCRFYHFNTHLDHIGPSARREEIKLLVAKIDEIVTKGVPFVVTGDMNSTVDEPIYEPLKAIAVDVRATSPVSDNKGTYQGYGNHPGAVIDQIFASGVECLSFRTMDENYGVPYISDHYPVIATLGIANH